MTAWSQTHLEDRSNHSADRVRLTETWGRAEGKPQVTAALRCSEAIMAGLVVLGLITIIVGGCMGAFLKLSLAIRREDRLRGSLRFDAQDHSAKAARTLVGMS